MLQSRPVTAAGGAGRWRSPRRPPPGPSSSAASAPRPASASGRCGCVAARATPRELLDGEVLVTHMTAPDWVPLMRRAAAIVTDSGGMTCHAAIVSRELGIPCVVGTAEATEVLRDGELVTVDAGARRRHRGRDGAGRGRRRRRRRRPRPAPPSPVTGTKLLVNLSEPSQLERVAGLDVDGVGLLRAELMVVEALEGVHPRLLLERGEGERFVDADGRRR